MFNTVYTWADEEVLEDTDGEIPKVKKKKKAKKSRESKSSKRPRLRREVPEHLPVVRLMPREYHVLRSNLYIY